MTPAMVYSKAGIALTERFEQCRRLAYQDQRGVWTIGWGHTRGVAKGLTCIQAQADAWEADDRAVAVAAVNHLVTCSLTQGEFDALVDFTFNLGVGALAHSTMLQLLNAGDYAGAAAQFDKWDHVNAQEVAGLLTRREADTAEFEGQNVPS